MSTCNLLNSKHFYRVQEQVSYNGKTFLRPQLQYIKNRLSVFCSSQNFKFHFLQLQHFCYIYNTLIVSARRVKRAAMSIDVTTKFAVYVGAIDE